MPKISEPIINISLYSAYACAKIILPLFVRQFLHCSQHSNSGSTANYKFCTLSCNFMSCIFLCIFMSCNLVLQFYVLHFHVLQPMIRQIHVVHSQAVMGT